MTIISKETIKKAIELNLRDQQVLTRHDLALVKAERRMIAAVLAQARDEP